MTRLEVRLVLACVVFLASWWIADFTTGIIMLILVCFSAFLESFRVLIPDWMLDSDGRIKPQVHAAVPVMLIMCSMVLLYFGTVAPVFIIITAVLDLIWSKTVWHIEN